MLKYALIGLSFLCLFNIAAYAGPDSVQASTTKEGVGLSLGAIIGGLIAGPPGAIIGAAGGSWFADRQHDKEIKVTELEKRLMEKQIELAHLQNKFSNIQSQHDQALQTVKLNKQYSALNQLSHGITLTLHYRTNSADIDPSYLPRLQRLANLLKGLPELKIQLEAHADQRGAPYYNKRLSQQRAQLVKEELLRSGIQAGRIYIHAYGETQANTTTHDPEVYVFDRRVTIQLTLDSEV